MLRQLAARPRRLKRREPHRLPVRLVVFDLDGTITYRDTLLPYVTGYLERSGRSRLRMARVVPTLAAFLSAPPTMAM